jgi:hypothetical protein
MMRIRVMGRVAVLAVMASLLGGCIVVGEGSTSGILRLRAEDETGQGVGGVVVTIEFPSPPSPDRFTTDAQGRLHTSGPEGTWQLTITPPAGYAVAASQTNPFSIRTRRLEEFHVTVRLVRAAP